jgi:hypothetical protein
VVLGLPSAVVASNSLAALEITCFYRSQMSNGKAAIVCYHNLEI